MPECPACGRPQTKQAAQWLRSEPGTCGTSSEAEPWLTALELDKTAREDMERAVNSEEREPFLINRKG